MRANLKLRRAHWNGLFGGPTGRLDVPLPDPFKYSRMRQVSHRYGAKARPWYRLDSGRAAVEGQKLHLEGFTAMMDVHYRPHVTRLEARRREIFREDDSIMFCEHSSTSLAFLEAPQGGEPTTTSCSSLRHAA